VLGLLLSTAVTVCLAHPVDLDQEVARRAAPWLPPDVARQLVRYDPDFKRGATAAANWPAPHHVRGGAQGVEAIVVWQCQRVAEGLRARMPFNEVVAGLGALAHLTVDLNRPFGTGPDGVYSRAFTSYILASRGRIPWVFYGQDRHVLWHGGALEPMLLDRARDMTPLGPIVREDMDRMGGPGAWGRLDDRSSTFGAASLLVNHAATDFVNLASWVWQAGGGLVPQIRQADDSIIVWRGEATPSESTQRSVISIRKARH
jgi:hypothetical protein